MDQAKNIRQAENRDIPQITEIYNQAIEAGTCTCDTVKIDLEQRREWFQAHENEKTPVFVRESGGKVIGYAYLSLYRGGRPAVQDTAEISYYVDRGWTGKGIGSQLIDHTIKQAQILGYRHLIAILLSCNSASIALLNKFGFEQWGAMRGIASICGKTYDHLYYGRHIG